MRIPYDTVVPQPRLFNQGETIDIEAYNSSRLYELIQHPVYCTCIVRHGGAEDVIHLTADQRSREILSKLVCIAVALNLHFQVNIERCFSPGEDPFDLLNEFPF